MNFFIIFIILVISSVLLFISYNVHSRQIDNYLFEQTNKAAVTTEFPINPYDIAFLKEQFKSEEFLRIHEKAVSENDPSLIEEWMKSKPTFYEDQIPDYTLYSLYEDITYILIYNRDLFQINDIYIQYDEDGITYNLIDPEADLLNIGTIDPIIEEFKEYEDNSIIPPTVYKYADFGWLCTACYPITNYEDNTSIAIVCADLDMNEVIRERHFFIINSIVFIIILTIISIIISLFLVNRVVIKPLHLLQCETLRFSNISDGYTVSDIIDLNFNMNDEIGDLYHSIKEMQTNIVRYTNDLTKITAEKERINTELSLAYKIQQSALPEIKPDFSSRKEFVLDALMIPAKEVGGDFYDFFYLNENQLALVIADVSGKGIPAALFMMSAKNSIKNCALNSSSPSEIISTVNSQICNNNKMNFFVTVWLGILDLKSGVLTACNAGHEEPVIRHKDGKFEVFSDKHCFVVGGINGSKYTDYQLFLSPGSTLFVYTDGVPEASDKENRFFEISGLLNSLNNSSSSDPHQLLLSVKQDIDKFVDHAEQFDDLTMLCITYKGPNNDIEEKVK